MSENIKEAIGDEYRNEAEKILFLIIELQVEEVLQPYVFDFNNPVTRLNIINSVSPILETFKDVKFGHFSADK